MKNFKGSTLKAVLALTLFAVALIPFSSNQQAYAGTASSVNESVYSDVDLDGQHVEKDVHKDNHFDSKLDEIIARGYIRVGTTGDYKPFTYLNPTTQTYSGMDIDTAKELAKSLGVTVKFVPTTWSTMLNDQLADKFDIAMGGVTRNTARAKVAQLTQEYFEVGKSPLVRAVDKGKYTTIASINKPEVKIALNPGGTNEQFVRANFPNATVTMIQNNLDIPGLIANGSYDLMLTDNVEALTYAKADPRLYAEISDNPFTKAAKGYMIQRDEVFLTFLNLWMDEMKLQGTLDKIKHTWVN